MDESRRELEQRGADLFDFGTGDPREPTDPRIRQALVEAIPETSQYPSAAGKKTLRETFADGRREGTAWLDPQTEVLPAAGSKEAIFHAPLAFPSPVARTARRRIRHAGLPGLRAGHALRRRREPLPVELRSEDGFLLPVEEIDPEKTRASGSTTPTTRPAQPQPTTYLERVTEFCREHDILLFSDECYNDIYSGEPPPSVLEITKERALAFCSLSKRSGMTGYRSAMMAGDPELIAALKKMRPSIGAASPSFIQDAATVAWSDDTHVVERRRIFGEKRALFVDFFERTGLDFQPTDASFYLWVAVPGGDDEAYSMRLLEQGIVVAPGRSFGPGGEGYVRVALVPGLKECRRAIEIWRSLIR